MAPKKKLTKKELDRKKKEEEDKKHQEEEEIRIKAEQDEKERIRREKIELEELKKLEKLELKKRSIELDEFRVMMAVHEDKLIEDEVNRRLKYSWERYLLCDGSPDPSIPHEINTYINLWREDETNVTIEPVIEEGSLCLRLISELESLIHDYKSNNEFNVQIGRYEQTISELQKLLQEKINRASLEMLSKAKMLVENETCNLEKSWTFSDNVLCLWGNIAKSAKITKFQFPEIGLSIFIPKTLTSMDVAFRILYTHYDHYSGSCIYFKARPKHLPEPEVPEPIVKEVEVVETPEAAEKSEETFNEIDLMDELNKAGGDDDNEKEVIVLELEEEIDPPPEDRIPSPTVIEWEDFDGENDVIDLRNFTPIGGLFQIDMVNMPPQPKVVKGWTMTQQVVPPKLSPFQYDMVREQSVVKKQSSAEGAERDTLSGNLKERSSQSGPIKGTIKLPDNIIVADQPTLAIWNESEKVWRTGNIMITENKEEEKLISFDILEFGIIGIFQDFHINMPFQSWCLRPYHVSTALPRPKTANVEEVSGESKSLEEVEAEKEEVVEKCNHNPDSKHQTLLIVNAAIFDVRLHICDNRVRILADEEHPELNALAGHWYSVPELITVMRSAGINIFPREDSRRYITITEKNAVAESMLYDQMALLSPSVAFSWSRWNSQNKSKDAIIVLASEHLNAERPVNEDDWSVLSFTRKKVEKLKMMEYEEKFSTEKDDRIEFHSNLFHFYQDFGCEEGMVAVKNIDCHYYDTIRNLLKAIRPIVFA